MYPPKIGPNTGAIIITMPKSPIAIERLSNGVLRNNKLCANGIIGPETKP